MLEKISLSIFSSLEILLVAIYLAWTIRILKATRTIDAETCKRSHLKWLFLASIALITLTVITMVLEFLVSWGVRASLVGLMYSLKLKIELAAFKHLESAAPDSAIIVGVRRTDGPIASMRQSVSTRYTSFAWSPPLSLARPRPEKMAKGKQVQGVPADGQAERVDEENVASVHEGTFGDKERDGPNDFRVRYFSEVALEPEKT
jgi:hypothetical protein